MGVGGNADGGYGWNIKESRDIREGEESDY